jgi:hypothetical protein
MDYPVEIPQLAGRRVVVQTGSGFAGPKLLLDGIPVARERGCYRISDASGQVVEIRLKNRFFDTLPFVEVNRRQGILLAPPLRWFEYLWALTPFLLILVGGAVGGAIGGAASYANLAIFRTERPPAPKFALTALISLGAFVGYALIALMLTGSRQPR